MSNNVEFIKHDRTIPTDNWYKIGYLLSIGDEKGAAKVIDYRLGNAGHMQQRALLFYYGGELVFEYDGTRYFVQGWTENDMCIMTLDKVSQEEFQNYLWKHEAKTMKECAGESLKITLWNGKVFMQIQEGVLWSDW